MASDTVSSGAHDLARGQRGRSAPAFVTRLVRTRLAGVVFIVALLGAWELLVRVGVIDTVSVPAFSIVVQRFVDLVLDGTLVREFVATFWRMFTGYTIAAVIGVGFGLAIGSSRIAYNIFEPITEVLRPLPSPAYIPIVILFFGIGHTMKIAVIIFACIWPIMLNTYSGVRDVPKTQRDTARTFQAGSFATMRKVIVPAASPAIFTGLRISLAIALIVSIIAEMVSSTDGLGYFILFAQRSFRVADMYAGIIMLGAAGYALNYAFVAVEGRLLRWNQGHG